MLFELFVALIRFATDLCFSLKKPFSTNEPILTDSLVDILFFFSSDLPNSPLTKGRSFYACFVQNYKYSAGVKSGLSSAMTEQLSWLYYFSL